jgi:sulfate permease, SulP family
MKKRHPIHRTLQGVKQFFSGERLSMAPWIDTARHYDGGKFFADARAAINVTVLAIPQAIAYAAIADLPIVYGIMCSAVAAIIAPFFAGSRHTILGPTNATAFMLFSFFATSPALLAREMELMPLLVLLVGFFCILGALLRVADLLQYISRSVLVGYIAGAAVLIIANQSRHVFGVPFDAGNSGSFLGQVSELIKNLHLTRWPTAVTALSTFIGYMFLQRYKPRWPNFALMMLASGLIWGALAFHKVGAFAALECFSTFRPEDLMPKLPKLGTLEIFDDIAMLTGVAMAVAFLASLENTVMARTLASRTGEPPQVNQDMFSVGVANVLSALCGAMPASGSLTRSTLNESSGARTRCSSLLCGIYTFVIALVISYSPNWGIPLIDFVPKAALGALIIGLAFQLINVNNIRICLRSTPDDAAVLLVTFFATLLAPLHTAIFLGVALSIVLFLRRASRPHVVEFNADESGDLSECHEKKDRANPSISLVHVEGDLFFGATEIFRTQIQRITKDASLKVIILRLKNARHLDATSVMALAELSAFVRSQQRHLIVSGCPRSIYRVLRNSGILAVLQEGTDRSAGESNVFCEQSSNPNLATRAALKRAQQLLGTKNADVVIYVDQNKVK